MTKFYRIKDTEIRKAIRCDENGEKQEVTALIGRIGELMERHIISEAGEDMNAVKDRWIVIPKDCDDSIRQSITYETLADAKASIPQA